MTGNDAPAAAKAEARKAAFAARKAAFTPENQRRVAGHLAHAMAPFSGRPVAGYLPIRTEADPRPAMATLAMLGPVGVPVVTGPGQPLQFRRWTPDARLVEGAFGVMVPEDAPAMVPRVLIVPMVAFDAQGCRLGYGGGFYDRTLAALRSGPGAVAVGLAFAAQRVDRLPVEPTDQPLDLIVTEAGVTHF